MMEEILKNMDEEKREKIINSALEEFSQNGYEKASTNTIVKKAKISKGLLFHYFDNKRVLFDRLKEYVIDLISDEIVKKVDWTEYDLFERIKQITLIKLKLMDQHPFIFDFMVSLMKSEPLEQLKSRYIKRFPDLMNRVYKENIDYSLFREDIDLQKVMHIIQWTFEKIGEGSTEQLKREGKHLNFGPIYAMVEDYVDVLKKAFYRDDNKKGESA